MNHHHFRDALDESAVLAALRAAEQKTTGQIRVFVSTHACPDALAAAKRQFHRLAMHRTRDRNAILIFIAPKSRKFALFGDVGIHQQCGEQFWHTLRDELTPHFQSSNFTAALIHAITRTGELLQTHFPRTTPSPNELPDSIAHD